MGSFRSYVVVLAVACSSSESAPPGGLDIQPTKQLFDNCTYNEECLTGECVAVGSENYCSRNCSGEADCNNPAYDRLGDCAPAGAVNKCFRPCTFPPTDTCSKCGCQDPQMYCASNACVPKLALLADCTGNWQCASGNCSPHPSYSGQKCLVAYGGPCTADNCEVCLNGVFCSRICGPGKPVVSCFDLDWPASDCILSESSGVCHLTCYGPSQATCDPFGFDCTKVVNAEVYYCENN
jgi:hypothetical protein